MLVLITKKEVLPTLNYYTLLDQSYKCHNKNNNADPITGLRPTVYQMTFWVIYYLVGAH
jgi:hypothetical protein